MAIPLLDVRATFAKIAAGFKVGKLFGTPPTPPSHPFREGRDPLTAQAQNLDGPPSMKASAFGGKTYSQRK
jgi:hypothetical protein